MEEAWGLISFDLDPSVNPNYDPPVIAETRQLYQDMHEPLDFCVLWSSRIVDGKTIRDYCFNPSAILACQTLSIAYESFRGKPTEAGFHTAIGCVTFAQQVVKRS